MRDISPIGPPFDMAPWKRLITHLFSFAATQLSLYPAPTSSPLCHPLPDSSSPHHTAAFVIPALHTSGSWAATLRCQSLSHDAEGGSLHTTRAGYQTSVLTGEPTQLGASNNGQVLKSSTKVRYILSSDQRGWAELHRGLLVTCSWDWRSFVQMLNYDCCLSWVMEKVGCIWH